MPVNDPSGPSTGVVSGGVMTVNGVNPAAFDITAASAFVITSASTAVAIPAQTVTLGSVEKSRIVNWWVADSTGTISSRPSQPTNADRRGLIQLGVTGSTPGTGNIFSIRTASTVLDQDANQLVDLMSALGSFSASGNQIQPNGANFKVNKTSGSIFAPSFNYSSDPNNPHVLTSPTELPATFRYATRAASSEGALVTDVDVANYDVNGVVTPVPGLPTSATIQRVYLFGTGVAGGQLAIQYGQTVYTTAAQAVAAIPVDPFVKNPDFQDIGILIAYLVVAKGSINLQDPVNVFFAPARKFAE